jgi:uncharacterized SAM-binding protein YcdF (DUF218 family)
MGWLLVAASLTAAVIITPPFVELRKLIGFVLMPATLVWILLLALIFRSWREPRSRWPLVATFVAYSVAGSPITSYLLLHGLERPFEAVFPLAGTARYDALLVMGGGSATRPPGDTDGPPQLGPAGDRLRVAAAIHAQGRATVLVTSGSSIDRTRDLSADTVALWQDMGVPATAVVRLPGPVNSATEVEAYARLVAERGWTRVGLVTSARHLPRALALCRRHGLQVDPLPADFRHRTPDWDPAALVPSGQAFADVQEAMWEYAGIAAVHLLGG